MIRSGWRAAVLVVAGLLVVCAMLAAVFWIGILLAALAVVAWFNIVVLPRIARRLRLRRLVLVVALLPVLAAAGLAVAGIKGIVAGGVFWGLGVALPRMLAWRLERRLSRANQAETRLRPVHVIDARFRA